jgi:hypothetical protein
MARLVAHLDLRVFVDLGQPRWARRKTSGAVAKVLGPVDNWSILLGGQTMLR